jgi:methionyl-tRNA formyltransferase
LAINTLADASTMGNEFQAGIPQDRKLATKAPRLKKSDGQLDFRYPVEWIDRQIRGLQPWPGVFGNVLNAQGKSMRMVIHKAHPYLVASEVLSEKGLEPGQIVFSDVALSMSLTIEQPKQWVAVVAKDGLVILETIQIAGKLPIQSAGFVSGYSKQPGLCFETPTEPHPLLGKMMAMRNS